MTTKKRNMTHTIVQYFNVLQNSWMNRQVINIDIEMFYGKYLHFKVIWERSEDVISNTRWPWQYGINAHFNPCMMKDKLMNVTLRIEINRLQNIRVQIHFLDRWVNLITPKSDLMYGCSQWNLNNEISMTVSYGEEIDSQVVIRSITCNVYNKLGIKLLVIKNTNIIILNKCKKSRII